MQTAQDIITTYSRTGTRLREGFFKERASLLQQAALHMARSLARDGRILILGEGAADSCARTAARAFLDRLDLNRPALPAILVPAGGLWEQGADRAALRQLEALARGYAPVIPSRPSTDNHGARAGTGAGERPDLHHPLRAPRCGPVPARTRDRCPGCFRGPCFPCP